MAKVKELTSKDGTPVDLAIRPTVVALWCLGIPTIASCEGHPETWPYPLVEIAAPNRPHTAEGAPTPVDHREWVDANLRVQAQVLDLLERFYNARIVPYHVRLTGRQLDRLGQLPPEISRWRGQPRAAPPRAHRAAGNLPARDAGVHGVPLRSVLPLMLEDVAQHNAGPTDARRGRTAQPRGAWMTKLSGRVDSRLAGAHG